VSVDPGPTTADVRGDASANDKPDDGGPPAAWLDGSVPADDASTTPVSDGSTPDAMPAQDASTEAGTMDADAQVDAGPDGGSLPDAGSPPAGVSPVTGGVLEQVVKLPFGLVDAEYSPFRHPECFVSLRRRRRHSL
jgi:hypothetical protein